MSNISTTQRCLFILNVIFQQCVAVVVAVILTVILNNYQVDNIGTWHIVLCTLGYGFFMSEAIVAFSKSSIFTIELNRKTNGYIHGVLMSLATVCVTAGISLKIHQKNDSVGSTHFASNHAILGLVSWILAMIAAIGGVIVVYSNALRNFLRPIWFKLFHNFLGTSSYAIGMSCLALGLYKDSFKLHSAENTRLALTWVIGILAFYSLIGAFKSIYDQIKNLIGSS